VLCTEPQDVLIAQPANVKLVITIMAPNKKKKKPLCNPARGFATVSTPSKKVDESPPEPEDKPVPYLIDGRPETLRTDVRRPPGLQHMSPEELEQHLEEAELQAILDVHGQRMRKDVGRQIARLETERRSLRQSAIFLETAGWLPLVMEEVLELARSSIPDMKIGTTVREYPGDTDLCVKIWAVQETLESLNFRNIEGALRHLVKLSSVPLKLDSSSLIWGLDEALNWLAQHSDPAELPPYEQQNRRYTPPTSRPRSPASACESGETICISLLSSQSFSCLLLTDDADSKASTSEASGHGKKETTDPNPVKEIYDDTDEDDPDQLIDKFLSAKYELLKNSLGGKEDQLNQQSSNLYTMRLRRRIERIERDVLFDRHEAMARWDQTRDELEIEHAKSKALERRHNRTTELSMSQDDFTTGFELASGDPTTNKDDGGEGLFGSIFTPNENRNLDSEEEPTVTISVRDFGRLGAGATPRKILEEICKAR
jgi:ATP-dependent RNA helicase DHX29